MTLPIEFGMGSQNPFYWEEIYIYLKPGIFCNVQSRIRIMLEISRYLRFFFWLVVTVIKCSDFTLSASGTLLSYNIPNQQMYYITSLNNVTVLTEFWQWVKTEIGDLDQVNPVYLAKSFVVVFFITLSQITTSSTWQANSPTVKAPTEELACEIFSCYRLWCYYYS